MENKAQIILWKLVNVDFMIRKGKLIWEDKVHPKPTTEELTQWEQEYLAEQKANAYIEKRAVEYPPMADYLDAIVKDDQVAIQAYIDTCNAVKDKHPKT